MFITFEGIDGSGKSTQVRLLAEEFKRMGRDVVITREPGGTCISEIIRGILLDRENVEMTKETELLLYAASRAQHMGEVILPALKGGKMVICERFVDSTLAYQGYGCGIDLDLIETVNHIATNGLKPELTILLDVEVEDGLKRVAAMHGNDRVDRIESRDKEFYNRVRDGYLTIASREPGRVKVIDSSERPPNILQGKILEVIKEKIEL